MKNFRIISDGKVYWISRHLAVAVFIYTRKNGKTYILANQRGPGTPDFQGFWNCPCGYLDFDETLNEAAARELKEETGYNIKPERLEMFYINSDPEDSNKQNVTTRFRAFVASQQKENLTMKYSEKNEVQCVKWIDINELNKYKWAFNHDKIIKEWIK